MLPKEGWIHEGVEDLKYPTGRCELCDTPIRFEHFVFHEEVGVLIIGCECAKRIMSGKELDYIKDQDRKMKAKARQEKATVERMPMPPTTIRHGASDCGSRNSSSTPASGQSAFCIHHRSHGRYSAPNRVCSTPCSA